MVLSTSTLNLKFMQRAAARNAQAQANGNTSAPSTPRAVAATAEPVASSSTPTPATHKTELTPQSGAKPISSAVEEAAGEEVWFMPNRSARPARTAESSRKWTFEPSYVPFLAKAREGSQGGGGRMKFGFGEEEKKEDEDEEAAGRAGPAGNDAEADGDGALTRPKGFDSESTRGDESTSVKTGPSSTLDRLRGLAGGKKRKHEEAGKKEAPVTGAADSAAARKSAESVVSGDAKASTGLEQAMADSAAKGTREETSTDKPKKKKKKSGKKQNKDRE